MISFFTTSKKYFTFVSSLQSFYSIMPSWIDKGKNNREKPCNAKGVKGPPTVLAAKVRASTRPET